MSDEGLIMVILVGVAGYLLISNQQKQQQQQQQQPNWFTNQSGCTPSGSSWRDMLDWINGGAANNSCTSGSPSFVPGGATLPPAGGATGTF